MGVFSTISFHPCSQALHSIIQSHLLGTLCRFSCSPYMRFFFGRVSLPLSVSSLISSLTGFCLPFSLLSLSLFACVPHIQIEVQSSSARVPIIDTALTPIPAGQSARPDSSLVPGQTRDFVVQYNLSELGVHWYARVLLD